MREMSIFLLSLICVLPKTSIIYVSLLAETVFVTGNYESAFYLSDTHKTQSLVDDNLTIIFSL